MSLLVYFDTNIFHNLVKRHNDVTEADELRLRAAVASGLMAITASHINIRETLAALESSPQTAREQLRMIVELADWERFVKFSTNLLEDDIRHFASNGERANTPFERNAAHIRLAIQRVIDGTTNVEKLEPALRENRENKQTFVDNLKKSRAEAARELEELKRADDIPSFEEFFRDGAEQHLLSFLKSFDIANECEQRGLDKLLRIPSIRAMVGAGMSFIYGITVEGRTPKGSGSDLRDLQHAPAAAAAADIFVTHDEKLEFLLRRVPIRNDFRVMRLHELLEDTLKSQRNQAETPGFFAFASKS